MRRKKRKSKRFFSKVLRKFGRKTKFQKAIKSVKGLMYL